VIRPRGWPRSPPSAWSFRRFFAADLDAGAERSEPPAQAAGLPVFALATVACTLAGFVVTSATGVAPAWAAFAGAALLAARALRGRRTTPAALARAAAVPFLAFVVCLGIVVAAVVANGLGAALRPLVPAGTSLPALLAVAALAALLATVVNNLPAVLVLVPLAAPAPDGDFRPILRMYEPDAAVLDGRVQTHPDHEEPLAPGSLR
jgi:arsenical pump membrane protein